MGSIGKCIYCNEYKLTKEMTKNRVCFTCYDIVKERVSPLNAQGPRGGVGTKT